MAITTTTLTDDNFKVTVRATGIANETKGVLLDASELTGATSKPVLSVAKIYYEILGTGNLTLFFDAETDEEIKVLSGRGTYGLIVNEPKLEQGLTGTTLVNPSGDILLSTDSNVSSYNLVLEFIKEEGFTNG
jgi:hypothetical protein